MILDIFKDSFEYCTKDTSSVTKLGLLYLLSIFLIPMFFIYGYCYRVTDISVNGTINGDDPLPMFKKPSKMFVEGLKIMILDFIYTLPITIIMILFIIGTEGMRPTVEPILTSGSPDIQFILMLFSVIIISIVLLIIAILFESVAIVHMIQNKSFKKALYIREIIAIIKSIGINKYIKLYLGSVSLIIGILSVVFLLSNFIGFILSIPIGFLFSNIEIGLGLSLSIINTITILIIILYIIPAATIFKSRAAALAYNMREVNED